MASKSTMKIQFPRGGTIPKEVLKADKDKKCEPGEPVSVPKAYGEHLVSDRFAQKVDVDSKSPDATSKKGSSSAAEKANIEKLKQAVTAAEKALSEADGEEAKATAKGILDGAKAALAAATDKS